MPDLGLWLDAHRSQTLALVAGALLALAFLALMRKAIKWFFALLVLAALLTSWWLSHEGDLLGGAGDLLQLLR